MATMDVLKLNGGNPANFLDVGGSATADAVKKAFELLLTEKSVRSIFVNVSISHTATLQQYSELMASLFSALCRSSEECKSFRFFSH